MNTQNVLASPDFSVLPSKLKPESFDVAKLMPRTALIDKMYSAREKHLMVLSAPAGYGKSAVLTEYRQRLLAEGAKVAWLSCDALDTDLKRLLSYLCKAITQQLPAFAEPIMPTVTGNNALPDRQLLELFVSNLQQVGDELYVIMDDFHHLHGCGFVGLIAAALNDVPSHVHFVVSTRFKVGMFCADSVSSSNSCWFNVDDLRFSQDEVHQYYRDIKSIQASDADIAKVYAQTEGWVTALHLASLMIPTLSRRFTPTANMPGTERNLADYFSEDVLVDLPLELQRFLNFTSVLDEFNAELCNALTDRDDAQKTIKYLCDEQLFIVEATRKDGWYRYHPLFAEYLQRRLEKTESPTHLLHAAAHWCESRELPEKAIKYAVYSRDYAFAAQLLETHGWKVIAEEKVYQVLSCLQAIPIEVIQEYCVFQIFFAWQLAFEQKYAESESLIEEISSHLKDGSIEEMRPCFVELLAATQIIKALVLLYQDKLECCLKVTAHWLKLVPNSQPLFAACLSCLQAACYTLQGAYAEASKAIFAARSKLSECHSDYLNVVTSLIEVCLCTELGELRKGAEIAERARELTGCFLGEQSRVGGPLWLASADILYEQDVDKDALNEIAQATAWRDVVTPVELISRGQLVVVRKRFYEGYCDQALHELDEWLLSLHAPGYERVYAQAMSCKVQFLLWLRRPNEAERICLQLKQHLAILPTQRHANASISLILAEARLSLSERRADKALAALEACLAGDNSMPMSDRNLRVCLLLSVAYWRKGNTQRSFDLLKEVVESGVSRGYQRLFIDDAIWLMPVMDAWISADKSAAEAWQPLAEMLRDQCRKFSIDYQKLDDNQDVSHREREILRFVGAGLSNRDIAQAVHLSEATIKWHLHNLFSKMGVRSRTQAVLKGKSLGLLSEA
ncbi:LuxR C-terminal-related transcriptional regulator [Pseudomonas sp. M30-35]|uniref:LuxR C-terminal-related transcriptional regulator n=1 Tax=Pseudomonas sp. M30-35 TaxID=1981174 RepID=UPI000B3C9ABD|nr:LuxR C-terminal-related transcriptional regulator [Pseudomonas sp. M30-35]ARU88329.1 LuxR family transcriptional regulator [Pseudomonas sp. M30-35]